MSRHGRRRKEDPVAVGDLLARALGRKEVLARLEANQVARRWSEAVGEHLAARSHPEGFDRGVLTVAVASAPWAQELRLRREELLIRLNTAAGTGLFTDVKFVIRALPKAKDVEKPATTTFPIDPEEIEIDAPEIAEVVKRALGRLRSASRREK